MQRNPLLPLGLHQVLPPGGSSLFVFLFLSQPQTTSKLMAETPPLSQRRVTVCPLWPSYWRSSEETKAVSHF